MRGGTDAAEEGVFGVGGPAGENQRIDAEGGDGEDGEQADVDVREDERNRRAGGVELSAKRDDGDALFGAGFEQSLHVGLVSGIDDCIGGCQLGAGTCCQ